MSVTPVVLIHSFPIDSRMWRLQVERLRGQDPGRLVLTPDLRGFGKNVSGPLPTSVESHAADIVELLDAEGLARAFVVGLSMGGYVALALHRVASERIAGLLLADTTAAADAPDKRQERSERAGQVEQQGVAVLPDDMIPMLVGPRCAIDVKLELRRLMLEQHPYGVAAALRALGARPDATQQLPTIDVPTAVVCGEHDKLTGPGTMRDLAATIPGASFELVAEAGHMTNLEAPEHFNQALLSALARVDRG